MSVDGDVVEGSGWADEAARTIHRRLRALADADDAAAMRSYMRDQFPFLGVRAGPRDAAWREVRAAVDARWGRPDGDELVRFARATWDRPERELRYVGAKALAARVDVLEPRHLDAIGELLVADAWWDTVDILAPNVVGPLARASPDEVVGVLDRWVVDEDQWLVRSAVIHQLKAKQHTDVARLDRHLTAAAPRTEWFVRTAVGWALRQHSTVDPGWVEDFVARTELRPLSRREAMRRLPRPGAAP